MTTNAHSFSHALQAQCRVDSPLGPLTLAATALGLCGAWFDGQRHHPGPLTAPDEPAHALLLAARQAMAAYWQAPAAPQALQALHALPLDLHGTVFQRAVWAALCRIGPGQTRRYGDIAQALGRPAAVRAVGAAVGRNPVSVLVPCHRVLGADGSLTGYAGGLERKQWLLAHEAARAPGSDGGPA
jgi:methylated-DNA-[protein]-cysteine S-methyltransferase